MKAATTNGKSELRVAKEPPAGTSLSPDEDNHRLTDLEI